MIISCVRSKKVEFIPEDRAHNIGFLKNPERFNVSITRAKALLIVIGNPLVLYKDPHWGAFLRYCYVNGGYTGSELPDLVRESFAFSPSGAGGGGDGTGGGGGGDGGGGGGDGGGGATGAGGGDEQAETFRSLFELMFDGILETFRSLRLNTVEDYTNGLEADGAAASHADTSVARTFDNDF